MGKVRRGVTRKDKMLDVAEDERSIAKQYRLDQMVAEATEKRKRIETQADFVVADLGNFNLKAMLMGDKRTVTVMRNKIAFMNQGSWEHYAERQRRSPDRYRNTVFFRYRGRDVYNVTKENPKGERRWYYVAVGDGAHIFGGQIRQMTEETKYDYDLYWGAVIGANLLAQVPDGSDNVVMFVAHPTKSFSQQDKLLRSTIGRHIIEVPTEKGFRRVIYTVREAVPFDEPIGGAVNFISSADVNRLNLQQGQFLLIFDIGGSITSATRTEVAYEDNKLKLFPIYDAKLSPSFSYGVNNVLEDLLISLENDCDELGAMKGNISEAMLTEGIQTGSITISGNHAVDVSPFVKQAEFELIDRIRTVYQDDLGSGRPFRAILTTGGGMLAYHQRLSDEVFNHGVVIPVTELPLIHLGNLYGGDIISQDWRQRELDIANGLAGKRKQR